MFLISYMIYLYGLIQPWVVGIGLTLFKPGGYILPLHCRGRTKKFSTVTSLNGLCCSTVFVLRTGECYPRQNLKLHILKCLLILIPNHKKSVTNLFLQISYTFRNCLTQNDIMDNQDQILKHTEVRTVM